MTPIPTIHVLAADIASRIWGMKQDSPINNASVIETLLDPLYARIKEGAPTVGYIDHLKASLATSRLHVQQLTEKNECQAEALLKLSDKLVQPATPGETPRTDKVTDEGSWATLKNHAKALERELNLMRQQRDHAVHQEEVIRMLLNEAREEARGRAVERDLR